jgi:hypothetical protein
VGAILAPVCVIGSLLSFFENNALMLFALYLFRRVEFMQHFDSTDTTWFYCVDFTPKQLLKEVSALLLWLRRRSLSTNITKSKLNNVLEFYCAISSLMKSSQGILNLIASLFLVLALLV